MRRLLTGRASWAVTKPEREPPASVSRRSLARRLERDHPSAAGSIREGLEETLTMIRLGLARRFGAH